MQHGRHNLTRNPVYLPTGRGGTLGLYSLRPVHYDFISTKVYLPILMFLGSDRPCSRASSPSRTANQRAESGMATLEEAKQREVSPSGGSGGSGEYGYLRGLRQHPGPSQTLRVERPPLIIPGASHSTPPPPGVRCCHAERTRKTQVSASQSGGEYFVRHRPGLQRSK